MNPAALSTLITELYRSGKDYYQNTPDLPPLTGLTLDQDDADLAKNWLRQKQNWNDPAPAASFEEAFARWNGSRFAFALSAGRKALSACIYALGLQPGDEVVVPGYTCIVVQNAFDFAGVGTVHCDIELDTYGPSIESVTARITRRTKAILLHHLYGLVCRDYEALLRLARERGLKVIEDCAHATGAVFRGRKVGTYGDVGFYSCEWSKVFTSVVGGIAVTDDPVLAERFREFVCKCAWPEADVVEQQLLTAIRAWLQAKPSSHWWALPWARFLYGTHDTVSTSDAEMEGKMPTDYYTRMPAPAAALALNQLRKLERYNQVRRLAAARWDAWCDQKGLPRPIVVPESEPVFLRYPVLVEPKRKKDTNWAKRELKVNPGVWFKTHLHPSPKPVTGCPNADRAVAQCINFPCLPMPGI